MPRLEDVRKEIRFSLKSMKGSEIVLRDGLLADDMEVVYDPSIGDVERTLRALSKMIVSWNLMDSNDKVLPITIENIKKFNVNDLAEIVDATSLREVDKKKLTSSK